MLLPILLAAGIIVFLFTLAVAGRPTEFSVARTATFAAPVAQVFPHVNTLRLWDLEAGTTIATFIGDDPVTAVAVSPNGRVAVAGDSRGRVMVFDLPPP